MPSYNHAPFITRCLSSIIKQSHRPLELIVIDDGSDDGSLLYIEQALNDCPFDCELLARPHRGLAQILNEGMKRSRGKYFAYLGSDDLWLQGFLESRVKLLQLQASAVLAYGHTFVINENDQILECSSEWAPYRGGCVREMLLHQTVPLSPSVLYRREVLERHGWNQASGLEDYDLYLRLSSEGDFAFDAEPLCAWRSHGNNTSRDLDFMLTECLSAQQRAVDVLDITADELKRARSDLKWRYASDFTKAGQKLKALRLICHSLGGAPSYRSVGKMIMALTLPMPVLRWRRRLIEKRATKYYGSIEI